jgi:hypothetical protein
MMYAAGEMMGDVGMWAGALIWLMFPILVALFVGVILKFLGS